MSAQAKLEPHFCVPGTREHRAVQGLLFQVGVEEKNWPVMDLANLLSRNSQLVGVFAGKKCVGGLQILYDHPYPCEGPPFSFQTIGPGKVTCEVTLVAILREHRRMAADDQDITVLEALAKGLFLHTRQMGVTHGYTLCEEWTFAIFDQYLKDDIKIVSEGVHYWCESKECPCSSCRPTYVCEIDAEGTGKKWSELRPEYWNYVNS